ncbi:MAG TPA: Crp/Fnr family transcriptional regulator [Chryseolinea sp.]|nr:Crp/Fnr family transcriptional regulator [Chryseolinea sp.]
MFNRLRAFFERKISITDEQFEFIKSQFIPQIVKKHEFIIRAGEVAKHGIFVASGCLRTYTIDDKGKEHIIQFSVEDWWTGDHHSFRTGTPTPYFIEALEDSEVLLFDDGSMQKVLAHIPAMATQWLEGLQKHSAAETQRLASSMGATAEERYSDFLKKYPTIAQRVPQHMIASYLGISPETLSRIRKQQSRKH